MSTPWRDDNADDRPRIRENALKVLRDARASAKRRKLPTVAMAQQWHRDFFVGCDIPVPYYAGEIRDTDDAFPELIDYEVRVGPHHSVRARDVPKHLRRFEAQALAATNLLDDRITPGDAPEDQGILGSVVTFAAQVHGEWVRIHPFANGNGRTARVWANWSLMRYGLPAALTLKPRPAGSAYAQAGYASMTGDHRPMTGVLNRLIQDRLQRL